MWAWPTQKEILSVCLWEMGVTVWPPRGQICVSVRSGRDLPKNRYVCMRELGVTSPRTDMCVCEKWAWPTQEQICIYVRCGRDIPEDRCVYVRSGRELLKNIYVCLREVGETSPRTDICVCERWAWTVRGQLIWHCVCERWAWPYRGLIYVYYRGVGVTFIRTDMSVRGGPSFI